MEDKIYLVSWVIVVSFLIFILYRKWRSDIKKFKQTKNGIMIIQLWDRIMISSVREYTLIFIFLIVIVLCSFFF